MALNKKLRDAVFARDQWKCRHCNNRNGLHPHHLIYKSHQGEDALENLITLCFICHRAHHDGFLSIEIVDGVVKFFRKRGWKP